ncbi:hypothetical protein H8E88_07090 [candidate division KSB1 bacterium]|nr:hypothetical protein [candidate division KSB1 bacterium]MBL7092638.1 hypothetical protein [candidate division KSB1 bacterium]
MITIEIAGVLLGAITVVIALISISLAKKTADTARQSNTIGLIVSLHQ